MASAFLDNGTKQTDPKVSQIHIYTRAHTTGHGHHTGGLQSIPTRGPVAEMGAEDREAWEASRRPGGGRQAASWGEGEVTRTGRGSRRCTHRHGVAMQSGVTARGAGPCQRFPGWPSLGGCREGPMALVHSSPGDTGFGGFDGISGLLLSCVQYGLGSGKREVASVHLGAASQQEGAAAGG